MPPEHCQASVIALSADTITAGQGGLVGVPRVAVAPRWAAAEQTCNLPRLEPHRRARDNAMTAASRVSLKIVWLATWSPGQLRGRRGMILRGGDGSAALLIESDLDRFDDAVKWNL